MINRIKFLLPVLFMLTVTISAHAFNPLKTVIDPHDSLLFDGGVISGFSKTFQPLSKRCFVKVNGGKGIVTGEVMEKEIVPACGGFETLWVAKTKVLKIGDILIEGTTVLTTKDSWVGLGIYLSTDETEIFPSTSIIVQESSEIKVPRVQDLCKRLDLQPNIPIVKGNVTYESEAKDEDELAPLSKLKTKGKRSSAKHKKTRYSHEVKFTESDTIDVIRVYKGTVEVTAENLVIDEGDVNKKMEKLGEDMQSGKLSAEEMKAILTEYQNFGQMVNELATPVNVDEGFKCTVTKNSRVVEPLGAGDEDNSK